jgi:serine/threonine-protein kinase
MVTSSGIKILDFGLAKFADWVEGQSTESTSSSHLIMGTPAYMAPEQLEGRECDARTDIFALGLLLFEMATGRRPFQGDNHDDLTADIIRCQPPLDELSPPRFARLVGRCLAKNPDRRCHSAGEIRLELDALALTSPNQRTPPVHRLWRWLLTQFGLR